MRIKEERKALSIVVVMERLLKKMTVGRSIDLLGSIKYVIDR